VHEISQLLRLKEVMNTLRSPGGCPWDAEQTHDSLLTYLLEESYEFIDAVESQNRDDMVEELGDLLLQVYFHARIGEEREDQPFTIEDIARGICDKLMRRHPHVFAEVERLNPNEVERNWEKLKATEKSRTSPLDGVPRNQPALSLTSKLIHRAEKHGHIVEAANVSGLPREITAASIGEILFAVVVLANKHGIDPEFALRARARSLEGQIR
jgi:XTP/dITP diphosphohydrolase